MYFSRPIIYCVIRETLKTSVDQICVLIVLDLEQDSKRLADNGVTDQHF